jgi:hypothetical protein
VVGGAAVLEGLVVYVGLGVLAGGRASSVSMGGVGLHPHNMVTNRTTT